MKKILFLAFVFAHFTAMAQRTGKDYAIFFVVTDFDYWADLPGIDKELREISSELETYYGFQKPDFYLNPKKADILKVLTDYQGRTFGPDDQLLVFFSMHGYYDEAIGALIPKDGLLDDPGYQSWLLHPALEAMLTRVKCKHILLSLDACYSGTFGQKYKDRPGPPAWEAEANDCAAKCKRALQHKSRLYLTSGGNVRTPTQSQFARKWLEALRLRNQDGLMSFPKLYSVLSEANPQPMYGDFKDNVVGGDFVFMRKGGCSPQANSSVNELGKQDKFQEFPDSKLPKEIEMEIPNSMILVKGGTFEMGRKKVRNDEQVHSVVVNDFFMSKYEITVNEFEKFIKETKYKTDAETKPCQIYNCTKIPKTWEPRFVDWTYDIRGEVRPRSDFNHPVIFISWNDATAYCNWISRKTGKIFRLPTEAEWEYAARGGKYSRGYKYAGSDKINDVAWYYTYSGIHTHSIGQKLPNELGIYDMTGNVMEWCNDWYEAKYYQDGPTKDPQGPKSGGVRVFRGGSWDTPSGHCHVAERFAMMPNEASAEIGFRLVMNASQNIDLKNVP